MYKYTPNSHVLHVMRNTRHYDYYNIQELLKEYVGHYASYREASVLSKEIRSTCFFSEAPRKQVPVGGFMLPVSMFKETVV